MINTVIRTEKQRGIKIPSVSFFHIQNMLAADVYIFVRLEFDQMLQCVEGTQRINPLASHFISIAFSVAHFHTFIPLSFHRTSLILNLAYQ